MKATAKQKTYIMSMMSTLNIDEEMRRDITFNVTMRTSHVSELTTDEASEMILLLSKEIRKDPERKKLNDARRRVMAAIGENLRLRHIDENMYMIEKIACRAAKVEKFNDIPMNMLIGIYNGFCEQNKALKGSSEVGKVLMNTTAILN